MIVEIKNTDNRLGIRKGQWYIAETYSVDPSKISLLRRIRKSNKKPFNKTPMCNQYRKDVIILK